MRKGESEGLGRKKHEAQPVETRLAASPRWRGPRRGKPRLYRDCMRVIAGQYRRRTLRSLPGLDIRPTADRLRETLFNVLSAGNPAALAESTWFDLYAG